MKILVLRSPQIPTQEEFFYIGSDADENNARAELVREGFLPHGTIEGRMQTSRNGREWIAYFKDAGLTAVGWHLRNAPRAGAPPYHEYDQSLDG